jgi:hypothetical protein
VARFVAGDTGVNAGEVTLVVVAQRYAVGGDGIEQAALGVCQVAFAKMKLWVLGKSLARFLAELLGFVETLEMRKAADEQSIDFADMRFVRTRDRQAATQPIHRLVVLLNVAVGHAQIEEDERVIGAVGKV